MNALLSQICTAEVKSIWLVLEQHLYFVSHLKGFEEFLKSYGGLASGVIAADIDPFQESKVIEIGEVLFSSIESAVQRAYTKWNANQINSALTTQETLMNFLQTFEEALNLPLWLWRGQGDANYQFRTAVDFCGWKGLGDRFPLEKTNSELNETNSFFLIFSQTGVLLRLSAEAGYPRRAPLLSILWNAGSWQPQPGGSYPASSAFAFVRWLQFIVCSLTEDWEYENSIFAVEFARARKNLKGVSSAEHQEVLADVTFRMNEFRDTYSSWLVRGLNEAQSALHWVEFTYKDHKENSDLLGEVVGAQALLLAAMQKIFLPASVSRHKYCENTFSAWGAWLANRIKFFPDDFATQLLLQSIALSRGNIAHLCSWVSHFLSQKSYAWCMNFDASPGLKALCWKLGREEHLLLSALFGIAVFRKMTPAPLGDYWLHTWASLVQMPETYTPSPASTAVANISALAPQPAGVPMSPHQSGSSLDLLGSGLKSEFKLSMVPLDLQEILVENILRILLLERERGAEEVTLGYLAEAFASLDRKGVLNEVNYIG